MNATGILRLAFVALALFPVASRPAVCAEMVSEPRFKAKVEKKTPGKAVDIDVDIAGAKELYLVVIGAGWGWADWAEPRLMGPKGELKLTELRWKFASAGYGEPRVNANVQNGALKISGKPVSYGIGVHDPSLLIYDVPGGYTRFKARGGLDDGGSGGPVTFLVYADNPLLDPKNPALWVRDYGRQSAEEPAAFVEMIGGDRVPGEVVEALGGDDITGARQLPSFLVRPASNVDPPGEATREHVRVIQRLVRRIVWQRSANDVPQYEPGTLFYRSGSKLAFRAARFDGRTAKLLTSEGVLHLELSEIARIDLPFREPWDAYNEQLAVLCPDVTTRLVQIETAANLSLTASHARLQCLPPRNHDSKPMVWHVGLQPAWSLDMLWAPHVDIVARREFAPNRVPLTRFSPVETVLGGAIGGGSWRPQRNANVQGGPLTCAGKAYSWGFGTQADTELHFVLPAYAQAFRSRVGLDHLAGSGGCARARLFVESSRHKPLWESPLLVGSLSDVDTSSIRLPSAEESSSRRLVLQTDAAHEDRPQGADPFDIRDIVDWVDLEIELDTTALSTEVDKLATRWVPTWRDWDVEIEGDRSPRLVNWWDAVQSNPGRYTVAVGTGGQDLTLSRRLQAVVSDSELVISVGRPPVAKDHACEIEVFVDDESVHLGEVPVIGGDNSEPPQFKVPLAPFDGQSVMMKIVTRPADEDTVLHWYGIRLVHTSAEGRGHLSTRNERNTKW